MKKTLCSLLTVVLLISCFAGTVNAAGRASGKFDIAVTAGELKPAKTGFPMAAGETVTINATYSPSSADSVKRHLSLICVVALVLAIMVPTVFAATTGYNYTYDFNLGSGGSKTYNGKTENALWYPGDGSGTWSIYVNGNSNTSVSSAKLYYIRSFNTDVAVKTMSSIDRGSSDSESFVGIDGKTYYAVITAKTNEGVYGTTNLSQ